MAKGERVNYSSKLDSDSRGINWYAGGGIRAPHMEDKRGNMNLFAAGIILVCTMLPFCIPQVGTELEMTGSKHPVEVKGDTAI